MNTQGERNVTGTPAIRLTDVGMHYGRKEVLKNITLDINRGDFMAITGPNGGGKTTLLRIMLGLLRPTAGSVSYLDCHGNQAPRLTIGYLPQKSAVDARFPITVEEVIRLGLMGPEAPHDNVDARVADMLARLELEVKAGSPVGELSGGQFQRALLGRALVAEPEVVILDEPLSYLDKHFEHELYGMLQEVKSVRPDTAIALVSHEMSEIAAMATRHVIIDHTLHICHSATHLVHYDCDL
ncbi:MAG: metal ABC transporter ATP-binding protein [Paramuribaculum sp.]|nr:metal ABC transporter ATP-binding protein [Paramuribaculum sp.]